MITERPLILYFLNALRDILLSFFLNQWLSFELKVLTYIQLLLYNFSIISISRRKNVLFHVLDTWHNTWF